MVVEFGLSDYNKRGYNGLMVYTDTYKTIDSPNKYSTNKIYSLSGSYNGKQIVFYENGKKYTNNVRGTLKYDDDTIYIIAGNPGGSTCDFDNAKEKIYSVRIYNRALTDKEVLQNYETDKQNFSFTD